MALRDQKEFTNAAFETEAETAAVATKEPAKTVDQTAAASVAATQAIARAATTSTAVAQPQQPRPTRIVAFAQFKDSFDTATVSALSQATPRITAEQGALRKDRSTKLGTRIKLDMVSWNHRWALGCGEDKMNDEMKQLYRVSYDNKTVDGEGCSVADYIESLKAQGYAKAKVSPYGDVWGYIVEIDGKALPVAEQELTLIQLAPSSLGKFTAFCVSSGIQIMRGDIQESTFIEVIAQDQTKGDKAYTNLDFKHTMGPAA